jgi:SRSO17 transposase
VFSAYVTTSGQAWADFNVYMPERWAADIQRRRAAGIPDDLAMATKPELATAQVRRLLKTGLPIRWAAFDEVYARSGNLRRACEASAAVRRRTAGADRRIPRMSAQRPG